MMFRFRLYNVLALIVALNYFAFRVELFEDEYEANHPRNISEGLALSQYSLNWETFDKDNAPKAFVVDTEVTIQLLCVLDVVPQINHESCQPFQPIRDKSPPIDIIFS